MTPTFTIVIGSAGRETLPRTLESIKRQDLRNGDQCLVGFDSRLMSVEDIHRHTQLVKFYGFEAAAYMGIAAEEKVIPEGGPGGPYGIVKKGEPYSWLGVEQINYMMRTVPITGSHIMTIGDDDVFVDDTFSTLRHICARDPLRPVIFRFQAPNGWILWDKPRLAPCLISGCCIAAPTVFNSPHPLDIETTHDYRWICSVVDAAKRLGQKSPLWLDYVGVIARPPRNVHRGIWTCPRNCDFTRAWGYLELGRPSHCPYCGAELWGDDEAMIVSEVAG